jgi:UPF0755 protein
MTPDDWLTDDAFVNPDDPRAAERERRRREREAKRRAEQAGPEQSLAAGVPPPPKRVEQPPPEVPDEGLAPGEGHAPFADRLSSMRERAAQRRSGRRRRGRRPGRRSSMAVRGPALLGLLAVGALVLWFLWSLLQPFHGDGTGRVKVTIPKGASVSEVGDILDEAGVVDSSAFFQIRTTLANKRSELYPGTYTLAHGMPYGDAIDELSTPPVKRTIVVTIPEGLGREEVAETVSEAGISGDYLQATEARADFPANKYGAPKGSDLEGFLFPATYELPARATADDLVERQLDAFNERIGSIDLAYAESKNLNTYDVLKIASMVEREVQVPEERPLVAAVIYNRLKMDIPLGIDATIRYALDKDSGQLTDDDLALQSGYNTRTNLGLPPTPIGNPGEASIKAAARPADVPYVYFVVKPYTCGEHAFSVSYDEFLQNAAAYQEALEAEGGAPTRC